MEAAIAWLGHHSTLIYLWGKHRGTADHLPSNSCKVLCLRTMLATCGLPWTSKRMGLIHQILRGKTVFNNLHITLNNFMQTGLCPNKPSPRIEMEGRLYRAPMISRMRH
jgi:hypothetical protein